DRPLASGGTVQSHRGQARMCLASTGRSVLLESATKPGLQLRPPSLQLAGPSAKCLAFHESLHPRPHTERGAGYSISKLPPYHPCVRSVSAPWTQLSFGVPLSAFGQSI